MATFYAAQKGLLTEVIDRIVDIEPEYNAARRFNPRPSVSKDLADLEDAFIAPRQFEIKTPGRWIEKHAMGKGYTFPLYEYDIVIQYPLGEEWMQACHSDVIKINRDLINNSTNTSGVQGRWIEHNNPVEPVIDDEDNFLTVTLILTVYYEVTG